MTFLSTKQNHVQLKFMSSALAGVLMTSLGVAAPMVALTQSATAAPADNLVAAKRLNKLFIRHKKHDGKL